MATEAVHTTTLQPYFYHPMHTTYNKTTQRLSSNVSLAPNGSQNTRFKIWQTYFTAYAKRLVLPTLAQAMPISTKRCTMADKCVLATDLEKLLGLQRTRYNPKSSDLITIRLRNAWAGSTADTALLQVHPALHYDAVVSIPDAGSQMLE